MNLEVEIHSDRRWSYANSGTRRPLVRKIILRQSGALPDRDINVSPRVTLDFPLPESAAEPWTARTPRTIESRGSNIGAEITWERVDFRLNYPLLGRLQEKVRGVVRVEIVDVDTDEVLTRATQDLELLAPNEYRFEADYHELIAAFVLPTDPFVSEILQSARRMLEERTGNSGTEGYQSDADPRDFETVEKTRAFAIANAVYDAMSKVGYDYSNPQGYFDDGAQRVRTPSQIKQENCATCLDSSVLMAACLAQAGLEPVIFRTVGHAFAGYFTGRPLMVDNKVIAGEDAVSFLLNGLRRNGRTQLLRGPDYGAVQELLRGGHILPIETTTTTRSTPSPFLNAIQRQNNFSVHEDDSELIAIVNVKLAWLDGVTPPIVLNDSPVGTTPAWAVNEIPVRDDLDFSPDLSALDEAQLSPEERAIPPRVRQWMASLLDLSSRNPLLKIKPSQMMEFDVPHSLIGSLDDVLHTPKKRIKLPAFSSLPFTWVHKGVTEGDFEAWSRREASLVFPSYKEFNSLHSDVERLLKQVKNNADHPNHSSPEAELVKAIRETLLAQLDSALGRTAKKLLDKANDVMLMTGNNSLYLALGTIAWSETTDFRGQGKTTEWCAPLYLYPVILEGGKGRPWSLRLDPQGEVTPNFCLHEKLKRPPYNIDLQELVNPETDEKGIDFDKMVKSITRRLKQAKLDNVAIQPRAVLGVFDYATFRLWKDLRDDWKKMSEISPVFKHIAYTSNVPYQGNPPVPTARLEPLLPIAADDSQRDAVQMALDGQSFKLEGPPGTGKSQTITNLLASCIAHNLKVLFVAEKQTALNAVKDRLDAAGLGAFSLNLHAKGDSDTKLRKNISAALTTALNANIDPADAEWKDIQFRLSREQAALDRYRASLHDENEESFSTWDANEQLIGLGDGPLVDLPADFVADFSEKWSAAQEASMALEHALDLVPDPGVHPWRFVGSINPDEIDFSALTRVLGSLSEAATRLEALSTTERDLLTAVTLSTLDFVSQGVGLHQRGLLPPGDVLAALQHGEARLVSDTFERMSQSLLDEGKSLAEQITPYRDAVSPALVSRADRGAILSLIELADSPERVARLDDLEREWALVAHQASTLSSLDSFQPIPAAVLTETQRLIEAAENSGDIAEYDRLMSELRTIQLKIREHDSSVSPSFVDRNDLADVEFRLKAAQDAGFLGRGRRTNALRELLGSDARASDDRLLVNSVAQMIPIARDARDVGQRLRARFPEVSLDGFDMWSPSDIDRLSSALVTRRIANIRELGVLADPSPEDRRFLADIKLAVAITPLVVEAQRRAVELLPSVTPSSLRPWISGDFAMFRRTVDNASAEEVVKALGNDALVADAERVVQAARAFLTNAERLTIFADSVRRTLFPGLHDEIRAWVPEDLERLSSAINETVSFLGGADQTGAKLLSEAIADQSSPSLSVILSSAHLAWAEFVKLLRIRKGDDWLSGRPLFTAISNDFPALLRDAGQNNNYLEFHRWQEIRHAVDQITDLGLHKALPDLLSGEVSPHEFLTRVRRSALTQALRSRMEQGNLDRFDRKVHERRIAAFEVALNDARKILNQRIPGLAASRRKSRRLPSGEERGATQDLLRGLNPKRGEKTPIRDLISKYGSALAEAMPCFLMSPDSVASLLPVGAVDFDVVIFDEASQIRTSHAVGALGRGKAGIVVGDSRQMPPSSTFSSNAGVFVDADGDGDPDEVVASQGDDSEESVLLAVAARDAESILTEFEESDLPQRQLLCHYRSKDEVLISFSNSFIYGEPMLTFPSPAGLQSTALRFVHVADGVFERDKKARPYELSAGVPPVPALRTNWREAELIVDEVLSRLRDPGRRARRASGEDHSAESIIIVTFNVPQMNLITELFKSKDAELFEQATVAQKLDDEAETEVPPQVKIRNLENVQGDEAETVIFSVAFSKRPDGKFPLNFGPVTRTGGERRLNVAVTRAQREMIVYASFLPDEMGQGGGALGEEARLLQAFLKLAHRGAGATGDVGINVQRSKHIEEVASELKALGFEVHTQLGLSSLRVDIALRRPGADRWEIAVMVDDTCWSSRGSAFQREILPRQVLPAMGWKRVYRIWLPAWKNSKDETLADMRKLLDADLEVAAPEPSLPKPRKPAAVAGPRKVAVPSPVVDDDFVPFTPYSGKGRGGADVLNADPRDQKARSAILAVIDAVLAAEAPIEENRFGKAVCRAFGFNRVTPARIEQIVKMVPKGQIKKDPLGKFIWREDAQWEDWTGYRTSLDEATRAPDEICSVEYRNALVDFVNRAHSISHDDAIREISRTFGFQRVTSQTRSTIEKALREAVKSGAVVLVNGVYHPKGDRSSGQ